MSLMVNGMVDDYFMAPADDLLRNYIRSRRDMQSGLTDERFIRLGITRAVEGDESGRAFVQSLADQPGAVAVPKSTWFDAFQSVEPMGSRRVLLYFDRSLSDSTRAHPAVGAFLIRLFIRPVEPKGSVEPFGSGRNMLTS